jgi:hypothetical protein
MSAGEKFVSGYLKTLIQSMANIIGNIQNIAENILIEEQNLLMKCYFSIRNKLLSASSNMSDSIRDIICGFIPDVSNPQQLNQAANPAVPMANIQETFNYDTSKEITNKIIETIIAEASIKEDKIGLSPGYLTDPFVYNAKMCRQSTDIGYDYYGDGV